MKIESVTDFDQRSSIHNQVDADCELYSLVVKEATA